MSSKLDKAKRLKSIKELRRKVAERNLLLAKGEVVRAEQAVAQATAKIAYTRENADVLRKEKLEQIFANEHKHGALQALAVSTYVETDQQIEAAKAARNAAEIARSEAQERANLAQKDMARKMLNEVKAEKLFDFESNNEKQAAIRQT